MSQAPKDLIEFWLDEVSRSQMEMDLNEVENIVYNIKNLIIEDNINYVDDFDIAEKENRVLPETGKNRNESAVPLNDIEKYKEDNERCADYYKSVKNYGKVEFWNFNDSCVTLEDRLQPRKFHHHTLKPSFFKEQKKHYDFYINNKCPNSPNDYNDLNDNTLIQNSNLNKNIRTYRFSKIDKKDNSQIEYLCRLCCFKRWILLTNFNDHMSLAHGIVIIDEINLIVLPPPTALYRQSLGRLKCYYCKCPNCWKWIRLGRPIDTVCISEDIIKEDQINNNINVVGLYTNYFYHFMIYCIKHVEIEE